MEQIKEVIHLEVTGVAQRTYYPKGYGAKAETFTMLRLTHNAIGTDSIRKAEIEIPGNLPLGTRFVLTIEQADDVTAATIHRGAFPVVEDTKLIGGGDGGVQ